MIGHCTANKIRIKQKKQTMKATTNNESATTEPPPYSGHYRETIFAT